MGTVFCHFTVFIVTTSPTIPSIYSLLSLIFFNIDVSHLITVTAVKINLY